MGATTTIPFAPLRKKWVQCGSLGETFVKTLWQWRVTVNRDCRFPHNDEAFEGMNGVLLAPAFHGDSDEATPVSAEPAIVGIVPEKGKHVRCGHDFGM